MKGRELKVDKKLKKRIEEGYAAITKAMVGGKVITEWGKQIVRLEKRLIEQTLGVSLTMEELEYVKTLCTIMIVFPGARVIEVTRRKRPLK